MPKKLEECKQCKKQAELTDGLCDECYAKRWDCGFETSSDWSEDLFGKDS